MIHDSVVHRKHTPQAELHCMHKPSEYSIILRDNAK